MIDESLKTIDQLRSFLAGTAEVDFGLASKAHRYAWIERTLVRFSYPTMRKAERSVLIRYLGKVTGYSRQQLTRLLRQFRESGRLQRRHKTAVTFVQRFTAADVRLLAQVDDWHGTLSGPATQKLLERAWTVFAQPEYQRLATISVSHLYNLRRAQGYARNRVTRAGTRSVQIPIGQRRKPQPNGVPGFLRIDSVHQGDFDSTKGVYHINAMDKVTQFEVVATVERISEAYLIPALQVLLEDFPFVIRGFHSDNARSTSTTASPRCSARCWWTSPSRAHATATTTRWSRARTARSCANTGAMRICHRNTPRASTPSTAST